MKMMKAIKKQNLWNRFSLELLIYFKFFHIHSQPVLREKLHFFYVISNVILR